MDKDKLKTMMSKAQKGPISELNSCITCKLCKGYYIDATTIIECLHTFCRSCIVRYLESNKYCPICDVQVHKTKPLLNIRRDKTIQDLVYKLVPRLYHNECKRRKIFYEATPLAKPSTFEESTTTQYEYILAPEETINLTLSYNGCSGSSKPRYLRCPSAVTILHLVKLIQAKYELTERHKVDIFYNQDILGSNFSLMDVAYTYSWKKKEPLNLTYKIYECRAKKPKLDNVNMTNNNNNNWKEVQLRISENGEMSITGIQDANMLELLDATENFESAVVINESKCSVETLKAEEASVVEKPLENHRKELPELKSIGKTIANTTTVTSTSTRATPNTKLLNSGIKMVINNAKSGAGMATIKSNNKQLEINKPSTTTICSSSSNAPLTSENLTPTFSKPTPVKSTPNSITALSKSIELSKTLNLNSELSVIPLNANVALSSCSTTTVFSTVNRSMCSTKSDENSYSNFTKPTSEIDKGSISKEGNNLKRKHEDSENNSLLEIPAKLPKPTILNHSIGLMNLSNNHPLKKHTKINRNGERKNIDLNNDKTSTNFTLSHVLVPQKSMDTTPSKPIIINKNLSYFATPKSEQGPKILNSLARNGEVPISKPSNSYQNSPIIIPSQLPHHQNLNSLQTKQTSNKDPVKNNHDYKANTQKSTNESNNKDESQMGQSLPLPAPVPNCSTATIKAKPSTPIGYKTLRDPPKSWNSQINSQIARVNQTVKAQQMANAAAAAAAAAAASQAGLSPGQFAGDLKSVRPAKFFKGRNVPRYLGNPASGVKPMYQVQISPDKDKNPERHTQTTIKSDKSEIKKHSIVKIDPKTLKPISEKAPEISNLSNMSSSLVLNVSTANNPELRINSTMAGDLKINTSSVSIFNPLKLQQSSPKNERKSPKSPQSPKVNKSNSSTNSAMTTTTASNAMALSPKQQRDKTSLTFTPSNPFVPNLTSPTLNPNQFLFPAGGFPSYDPRVVAAYHSLWYSQRMAAAAAAGLVPSPLPHAFGLNMGLNSPLSPGVSSKHSTQTKPTNQPSSRASHNNSPVMQKSSPSPSSSSPVMRKSSPSPNSNSPIMGKSSPNTGNKKLKDTSAGKTDKSLETALEKITQNKAKELNANNKEVTNGSPVHGAAVQQGASNKGVIGEKVNQNCQRHSRKEKNVKKASENQTIKVLGNEILKNASAVKEKNMPPKISETKPTSVAPEMLTDAKNQVNSEEKEPAFSVDKEASHENTKQPPVKEIQKEKPSEENISKEIQIRLENTSENSSCSNSGTNNKAADEVCSKTSDNLGTNGDKDTVNEQLGSSNEQSSLPGIDNGKALSVSTAEEKNEADKSANDVSQKKSEAEGSLGGGDGTSSV
ncbi:unnamed protein product [Ceutorhynchus assimilis]|uniref:RING-type domain-containing protein n=1 Tax=Ceutorhynchus assimilis TaxID=467358 RepID=A0A9N9QPC2_9CUCU|nr:unnamed protein product [Ceutorhynchus assimilis]